MSQISDIPFDGARVWTTLTPDVQARVGALALEFAAAGAIGYHGTGGPVPRAVAEAARLAFEALTAEVSEEIDGLLRTDAGAWHLPSVLGLVCHTCGCSHQGPCDEGCGWHDAVICTAGV